MRWLLFALTVSALFVVFVVVAAVQSGPPEDPDRIELHEPESDDEKAAARVVIAYVRALMADRPAEACRYVAPPLEATLRCTTRPQIPRDMYVEANSQPEIEDIGINADAGSARVVGIDPGPAQSMRFARVGKTWRVVKDSDPFAFI